MHEYLLFPICKHEDGEDLTETWDYRAIQNNGWKMNCESWELKVD